MSASTVLSAYPLSETFDKDCAFTRQNGMYAADITLSRSTSGSGSSDVEAPGLSLTASDTSSTSASSTELDSPSDGEEDFSLDGASTGIPSPFILSPRRLDTPCTPLLLRECGGRFPFPAMDRQDAGYDSDSDKKASKRGPAARPRLRRAGSVRVIEPSAAGARSRARSLLVPASSPPEEYEAAVPAAVAPPPPPPPKLARGNHSLKIDLPPPTVPKDDAKAALGRGLPSRLINSGRRAASGPMPAAPRLCATTLADPRSPSPLDLPSHLCISPQLLRRERGKTIVGLIRSVLSTSSAVPRRLATKKHQVPSAPPPTPCTPLRMVQQQRSLLAPREALPRLAAWKKPDSPVEQLTSSASAHNPYFDNAVVVPGVGAMLASSAAVLLLS